MAFGAGGGDELAQGLGADQRHVAVQHQHQLVVGDVGHGLHDGVAGAELFGLQCPLEISLRLAERRAHRVAAVAIHHVHGRRVRARGRG